MLDDTVISIATRYWAGHLGCTTEELFFEPLHVVTHGAELADYDGVFALFRGSSAIVSLPPARAAALNPLLIRLADGCSPEMLAEVLRPVAEKIIGPASIGYCTEVIPPTRPIRALSSEGIPALQVLQKLCTATEWEHGGSSMENPCSGAFADGQLVALAGYEIWGGKIAHISVITHPGYRGQGYARSAVAHIAVRAVEAGLLPQYRTLESNSASIRISETLGFQPYARSLAARFDKSA